MLREQIGLDNFWKGLKNYYEKYEHGNADTHQFRNEMELVSGTDLKPFFDQWLTHAGHPVLKTTWEKDPKKKEWLVKIEQVQENDIVYQFPLEVALYPAEHSHPILKKIDIKNQITEIRVPIKRGDLKVKLDPAGRVFYEEFAASNK